MFLVSFAAEKSQAGAAGIWPIQVRDAAKVKHDILEYHSFLWHKEYICTKQAQER